VIGGIVVTPVPLASGRLFTLGILLIVIGVDALIVPGYLVFKSPLISLGGLAMTLLGLLALVSGWKKPKVSEA
jgi:hypothetical protein